MHKIFHYNIFMTGKLPKCLSTDDYVIVHTQNAVLKKDEEHLTDMQQFPGYTVLQSESEIEHVC